MHRASVLFAPGAGVPSTGARIFSWSLVAVLVAGLFTFAFHQLQYGWNWSAIWVYREKFLQGWLMTVAISGASLIVSLSIGVLTALARRSSFLPLRYAAALYVEIIRGTPLLVQIFIFYFFIGTVLNLSREFAGIAALSLFTGAYVAEIIRSGVQSIARGQNEAARSLGLNGSQSMRYVVLPQAFKRVLPPLAGQFISLVKDTSLVSVIAITELLKSGREVITTSFSPFEILFCVAGLYLLINLPLSHFASRLERRLAQSD